MRWIRKLFGRGKEEAQAFRNQGTTKREKEVARLLGKMIPGRIVEAVRFAGSGGSIYVSVDIYGGRAIGGGYVDEHLSAKEQADSIYKYINAQLSV